MKRGSNYTKLQMAALVVLRLILGWHILYEGLAKLLNPQWSSVGFLQQSHGILSGFALCFGRFGKCQRQYGNCQ